MIILTDKWILLLFDVQIWIYKTIFLWLGSDVWTAVYSPCWAFTKFLSTNI